MTKVIEIEGLEASVVGVYSNGTQRVLPVRFVARCRMLVACVDLRRIDLGYDTVRLCLLLLRSTLIDREIQVDADAYMQEMDKKEIDNLRIDYRMSLTLDPQGPLAPPALAWMRMLKNDLIRGLVRQPPI